MRINQNISAMNTHASMVKADNSMSKSLERLSSGYRINRAADDAAGLAISEKMRGQISGLKQASKNAQDGISLLQTAEGNLNESHSILQRMRELADQAANGTVTDSDRAEIQKEMNQLTKEVDRIAKDTEFNTMKLLRGTAAGVSLSAAAMTGGSAAVPSGAAGSPAVAASGSITLSGVASGDKITVGGTQFTFGDGTAGTILIGADDDATAANFATAIDALGTVAAVVDGATANQINITAETGGLAGNGIGMTQETGASATFSAATLTGGADLVPAGASGSPAVASTGSLVLNRQLAVGNSITVGTHTYSMVANGQTPSGDQVALGTDLAGTITNLVAAINADSGNGFATANADGKTINLSDATGANLALATNTAASDHITLTMQIGANAGQSMDVDINNMDAGSLGIGRDANGAKVSGGTDATQGLDVTSSTTASQALTAIDDAINKVSSERSKLGAYQNRLDHTVSNLSTAAENLSASESRIRDVDMADEMSNFSRAQILMQASTAMMAQANQKPQAVLKLLG